MEFATRFGTEKVRVTFILKVSKQTERHRKVQRNGKTGLVDLENKKVKNFQERNRKKRVDKRN